MTLGVREGVIALIVLVAVYMAFELLRMRRLQKKNAMPSAPPVIVPPPAPRVAEPFVVPDDAWEKASSGLAEEVLHKGLEQELAQLREEVDAMRGELAALRDDMQQDLAHMRAAQSVSPIYGDAMQMAAAGYDPAMIAERCGIARAEAELVVALAKSQER
jgi:hypothetical protein